MNYRTPENILGKEYITSQQKISVMDNKGIINVAGFN